MIDERVYIAALERRIQSLEKELSAFEPKEKDSLCNLCGLTRVLFPKNGERPSSGLCGLHTHVSGGYFSTPGNGYGALDDTTTYHFSLCEFCLDWLFEQFQIPVDISCYMGGPDEAEVWRPASQRVLEDEWRKDKKCFYNERDRRAIARGR